MSMVRHNPPKQTGFQAIASLQKIFFILAMLLTSKASGQLDHAIEWKMIETPKALWLFDAKHQELANHYVELFNRVEPDVHQLFGETPRRPTFVLLDNTDIANGSAQVVPQPIVNLLPVIPSPHSSIGQFKNSAYELTAHEYTHILNMEPTHGWIKPLKWIFGSIARPNMMLPRWYTEGLAVFTESYLSPGGGRLHSQHLAGVARSLTLSKRWDKFPLSQINDGQPDWLGGSRPYLFGGILWQNMMEEKSVQRIAHNNRQHARRPPFFLDAVENYEAELQKAYGRWKTRAEKQILTIKEKPTLRGRKLKQKGYRSFYPSISPNGKYLVYITHDHNHRGKIYKVRRHKKRGFRGYKAKEVTSADNVQTLAWHPDSSGFVYESTQIYKAYYNFYDLHFYDLKQKKSKRLTKGQRASHPCFSPNGKKLFFIQNTPGGRQIVKMEWATKKMEVLYQPAIGTQLMYLGCPKENIITFSEQKAGEDSNLLSLDITTKQTTEHLQLYHPRFSKWTHKGLIFSSSRSGVENLYLAENIFPGPASVRAITNTLTRINHGDFDPLDSTLYFSEYASRGPKIYSLKGAQWESFSDTPPTVPPLVDLKTPKASKKRTTSSTTKYKTKDFSPWRYMLPNHWIPFIFLVDRGTIFQANTSAGDPLGINSYTIAGQYDTLTKEPGIAFSYQNNSWPISLGFGISDVYSYFYPTDQKIQFRNGSLNSSWRIFSWSENLRFGFHWNYSSLSVPTTTLGTVELIRQGPSFRISYADVTRRGREVAPEQGWTWSLSHRNYLADAGNRSYEQTRMHLGTNWSTLFGMFSFPKRHSLYLGMNGSYSPKLEQNSTFFRTSSLSGPFQNTQFGSDTIMQRGYPSGNFVGWNLLNFTSEYRFPIWYAYRGLRGPPFFFRRLYGHLVFDALSLDGHRVDIPSSGFVRSEFGSWFTGYGIEFHADTNIGFHLPVTFTLGLYQGVNGKAGGDSTLFFNLRL